MESNLYYLTIKSLMNIKSLSLIFGSKTKAQEIFLLLNDVKKVVRQGFYQNELDKIQEFCAENKIHCVKSKFKVLLADENAYTNKGIRIPETDKREGMYFIYLSKDEKQAWLASYYELVQNDHDLGVLLGYPSCCIDFFCKRFSEDNPNLQLHPTNAFTNLTKREQDLAIISHFPCSSDCEESIKQGMKFLDLLINFDRDRAEELARGLKV